MNDHKFIQLWDDCVGKPGYVKSVWSALHVRIYRACAANDQTAYDQILSEAQAVRDGLVSAREAASS